MMKNGRLSGTAVRMFGVHHASWLLFFGLIYVFLVPPFQSPDEPNHFFRAWQCSEGHIFPEKNGDRLGGFLPAALPRLCDSFACLKNNPAARMDFTSWRRGLDIALEPDDRRFTDFANTAIYAPGAYLPQAAAIAVLRPLRAGPLLMLYAARTANLLTWILLVSAALRLMPFLRTTIAAIALLPATLCIAASANADVVTNGLCWWLTAALLFSDPGVFYGKKLLAVMITAANKLIALPLVFLMPFSPDGASSGSVSRFRLYFLSLLTLGLLSALIWGSMAQRWFIPYDTYDPAFRDGQTLNSGVDPARQLAWVLEKPFFFISVVCRSVLGAAPSTAAHFVGKFGWEKNYMPAFWIAALWIMLSAMLFSEKNLLSGGKRLALLAVTSMYVAAFALTMYMLWSAVGASVMDNWQGRYFLAVAPLVVLALSQGYLEKYKREIDTAASIILILGHAAMIASIIGRYYPG